MPASPCQVAVVGAGPYGLAAAAHLRAAGVQTRVFGEAMEFWRRHMPIGLLLRSPFEASHISDPHHTWTLDAYQAAHGVRLSTPVPLEGFIGYGLWFQGQVVPDLDRRRVARIEAAAPGFRLLLEDGEPVHAQRIVIAAGIAPFAYRLAQFAALPPSLASHSSEHRDLGRFAGQQVVVVGGAQSALESAALLHEGGADVEVVMRAPRVRCWLGCSARLRSYARPIRRFVYPPTHVGPPGLSWILSTPQLYRRLPPELRHWLATIRPAALAGLLPRVSRVRKTTGRNVVSARPVGKRLCITLDDGTTRCVDHALLATGYRVDIARYTFLAPDLMRSLRHVNGYPQLTAGLESSVPGLHFLGLPAALTFGPLMHAVAGTGYAARALTRCVLGARRSP